ncbi:MAG: hypothetical protein N2C12_09680, partial [Planctomycetales bacterium]
MPQNHSFFHRGPTNSPKSEAGLRSAAINNSRQANEIASRIPLPELDKISKSIPNNQLVDCTPAAIAAIASPHI